MKHTKEEILKALHVIKDTCEGRSCQKCPFGDNLRHCIICEQIPSVWDIKSEETWRAFE